MPTPPTPLTSSPLDVGWASARWCGAVLICGWLVTLTAFETRGGPRTSLIWSCGCALWLTWHARWQTGLLVSIAGVLASLTVRRAWGLPQELLFGAVALGGQCCLLVWTEACYADWRRARALARIDFLTGCDNRLALLETISAELARSQRHGRPFALAMFDCDGFKQLNDREGHARGDAALRALGQTLQQNIRCYDSVGRLGGDEFVVVLPETDLPDAEAALERLRANLLLSVERQFGGLTLTAGVMVFECLPESAEHCLALVDEVMYRARRNGRSCTEFAVYHPEGDRPLAEIATVPLRPR